MAECTVVDGLTYCKRHHREVCNQCCLNFEMMNSAAELIKAGVDEDQAWARATGDSTRQAHEQNESLHLARQRAGKDTPTLGSKKFGKILDKLAGTCVVCGTTNDQVGRLRTRWVDAW